MVLLATPFVLAGGLPAMAAEVEKAEFNIPAQSAPQALRDYAEQAGMKILFPQGQVEGKTLNGVSGYLDKKEALSKLLEGEGLSFRIRDDDTVTVFPAPPEEPVRDKESDASVANSAMLLAQADGADYSSPVGSSTARQPTNNDGGQAAKEKQGRRVIDEVTVTAQKRETLLRETPVSMTNLGSEVLIERAINNIQDMEHLVPGLKIGQSYSAAKVTIRGIGNENIFLGGDPGVAFHVDNVYIARTEAAMAAFFDIDRVEVLRGPQGTLYGRNATGGVINVISKRPTEDFEGQAYVEGGNFSQIGGGGVLSGPILKDKLLARVSFRVRNTDGYVKNVVPDRPDLNSEEFFSVRAQLLFQPTDDLSIHIRADYHEDDDTGPTSKALGTLFGPSFPELFFGATVPVGKFVTASNIDSYHKTKLKGVSATVNWDLGGVILTSISALRSSNADTFVDTDGTAENFQTVSYTDTSDQFSQELRLMSDNDGSWEWLVGAYYFNDDSTQDVYTPLEGVLVSADPLILIPLAINLGGALKTESYAFFGSVTWKISDFIHLTGGLRYTYDKKKIDEYNDFGGLFGPVPVTAADSTNWDEITYNAGIQIFPIEDTMVFATLSKGFKGGGYNAGGLTPSYEPETALNIELGVKSRFLNDRVELSATLFHTNYRDLQVAQVVGLMTIITNAAKAELQGVEVEGVVALTQAFLVRGTFSYLDAKFRQFFNTDVANPGAGVQDLAGRRLANSPKVTLSVAPQYTVDIGNHGSLTVWGTYYWQARTFFEAFNNLPYSQKGVGRFDVGATFESATGGWRLIAYGKNLGNREVLNSLVVGSAQIGGPGLANLSRARTYGARFEWNF